jgi:hypothetical protein
VADLGRWAKTMAFRDSSSFGKRQEYSAIAELLKRNFDVYMTLVDDQGIDCIVRLSETNYVDIQIKARSKIAKQWTTFAAMRFKPRKNLFFIFYTERNNALWVVPSIDLDELCYENQNGINKGSRTIVFPKSETTVKAGNFRKYFKDAGFEVLRNFRP